MDLNWILDILTSPYMAAFKYFTSLFSLFFIGYFCWHNVYDYNNLADAVTAIGANDAGILIFYQQDITADLVIPANVTLRFVQGGSLNVSGGVTVTINGFVEAPPFRIWFGAGSIIVNTYPQDGAWEGATQNLVLGGTQYPLTLKNDGDMTVWYRSWSNVVQDNPTWKCQRGRGTEALPIIVQEDDPTGEWTSYGWDGAAFIRTARIYMDVDGVPGIDDMPGRIDFEVTPAGEVTPVRRMSLKQDGVLVLEENGRLGVGKAPDASIHCHVFHATEKVYLEIECGADNATLVINSGTDAVGPEESAIHLKDNHINKWAVYKETDNSFIIYNYADTSTGFQIKANGDVMLPSILTGDAGDWPLKYDAVNGIVYDTSDIRQKKNIKSLKYGLVEILRLEPKSYKYYIGKTKTGRYGKREAIEITKRSIKSIGLIAQEVYDIIPEAVYKPEDETVAFWALRDKRLMPVLINAIKELNEKIETLEGALNN